MIHCSRCPIGDEGILCPGEEARRLCDLIDPSHRDYRPAYVATIAAHARPRGESEDPVELLARLEAARLLWESMTPAERASCCGQRGGPDVS